MAYQTLKLSKNVKFLWKFRNSRFGTFFYMGSYMESINSKPDLIPRFQTWKFENFWNIDFHNSVFFSVWDRDRSCEIVQFNVVKEKLNSWSKIRAHFADARVWIVFRRDRSPNFFVAGLNQSDPRHWTCIDQSHHRIWFGIYMYVLNYFSISISTLWALSHDSYLSSNYDVTDCSYHVTRKNFRGRISQNLRAHTILITWRVSVCSIVFNNYKYK